MAAQSWLVVNCAVMSPTLFRLHCLLVDELKINLPKKYTLFKRALRSKKYSLDMNPGYELILHIIIFFFDRITLLQYIQYSLATKISLVICHVCGRCAL